MSVASPPRPRRSDAPGEVGIWAFITLDMFVFALFFGIAAYYRVTDEAVFASGQDRLSVGLAFLNTLVLLMGSLTAVRAVQAARADDRAATRSLLAWTAAAGMVFALVKAFEYGHLFAEGYSIHSDPFFLCFFGFTIAHLLHVGVGTTALLVVRGTLRSRSAMTGAVESAALYWHMVDVLWLVLFPLLYLR